MMVTMIPILLPAGFVCGLVVILNEATLSVIDFSILSVLTRCAIPTRAMDMSMVSMSTDIVVVMVALEGLPKLTPCNRLCGCRSSEKNKWKS
jgi:hypothetical protein